MTRRIAAGLAGISAALTALHGAASAQVTDFATCPATLPACGGTVNDCCYQDFPASGTDRAVIIPMDRCHQQIATSGVEGPPANTEPKWCVNSSGTADNGMIEAYGLVYRLMQNGIHVYWLINPTKYPPALTSAETPASSQTFITQDIDFWVLNPTTSTPPTSGFGTLTGCGVGCTDPVRKLNSSTLAPTSDSYNATAFPVRGGAFVIAAADRTRFNNFWKRTGEFSGFSGDNHYDFSAVDLYEVNTGAKIVYQRFNTAGPSYTLGGSGTSGAPVAIRIDYDAPRLARLAPAGVSDVWLSTAKLDDDADSPECLYGAFEPSTAVYCDVSEDDIQAGSLIFGRFDWAWIDNWSDNSPCGDAAETTQVDEALQFMMGIPGVRAGGNVMFMDAVIKVMESSSCGQRQPQGLLGTGVVASNVGPTEKYIIRYPQSTFTQWGDLPTTVASGSAVKWNYYGSGALGYDSSHTAAGGSLVRLLTVDVASGANTQCTGHRAGSVASCDTFANAASADIVDFASYVRYNEDQRNGLAFYTGGNNVNGRTSHLRLILNALLSTPNGQGNPTAGTPTTREITRSSPIVATVNDVERLYQGSIEIVEPATPMTEYDDSDDDATFVFPYFKGHLRAVEVATGLDDTDDTALTDLTADFDVGELGAGHIPEPTDTGCDTNFTGTCRSVFTTIDEPGAIDGLVQLPDRVFIETGRVDDLKPLLGSDLTDAEGETLISRILAGTPDPDSPGAYIPALGGVDRSTVAIIEDTPRHERPTMIYVGATDGMLHAICAEAEGACPAEGRELWAFMPRTQLPLVRENTTRIDGSPKVAEVYGDFYGTGSDYRTILTFQSGWGQPGMPERAPSVIALDITEPDNPIVVWEWTTRATRDDVELGVGMNLAMAPVRIGGATVQLTVVQTNNGGLGDAGFYLAAINTETGELVWEVQDKEYPTPQDSNDPVLPTTGVPSGVAMVDRTGEGLYASHIVVPSLYGDVWLYKVDGDSELVDPITLADAPLFRFSEDFHPVGATPTIYADLASGTLHAAFTSGGYHDQLSPLGIDNDWSPDGTDQWLIAVSLTPSTFPMDEDTAGDFGGERPIKVNLGANERGFAQAIVTGDDILVVTDSTDVNLATYGSSPGTGAVRRHALTGGAQVGNTEDITGGASSVEITGDKGNVVIGSGSDARRMDVQDTFGQEIGSGRTIEVESTSGTTRLLWLGG